MLIFVPHHVTFLTTIIARPAAAAGGARLGAVSGLRSSRQTLRQSSSNKGSHHMIRPAAIVTLITPPFGHSRAYTIQRKSSTQLSY